MKPYHSILLFMAIVAGAIMSGHYSYRRAEDTIVADMNRALSKTVAQCQEEWITPDTIRDYRRNLTMAALRPYATVQYYAVEDQGNGLRSCKMRWRHNDFNVQGYAHVSFASVLLLSDQRLSAALSLLAVVWGLFSVFFFMRQRRGKVVLGEMMLCEDDKRFYTLRHDAIRLTPMQNQLMQMFFRSETHELTKQEICDCLWPKKPDASATLYTLIKRLRPIIEEQGKLKIASGRGQNYRLSQSD